MDKRQLWHFSKEKDIEQTADDPASGRPAQPDHFPNVVRPGGGYPEGRGEKTDAFCNKCKDQLIDGSCLRCDWGPQNRSVPVENFPLDPFRDDKAGIRAASWKLSAPKSKYTIQDVINRAKEIGFIWVNKKGEKIKPKNRSEGYYLKCKNQHIIGPVRPRDVMRRTPQCKACYIKEREDFVNERGYYWGQTPEVALTKYPLMCQKCNEKVRDVKPADALRLEPTPSLKFNGRSCKNCLIQERHDAAAELGYHWDPKTPPLTSHRGKTPYNLICNTCGTIKRDVRPGLVTTKDATNIGPCPICHPEAAKKSEKYQALNEEHNQIVLDLIQKAVKSGENYSPTQIVKKFTELTGQSLTPAAVRSKVRKMQKEGIIPQSFKSSDPEDIVYLFQLGTEIKIGIANDMPKRIEEYLNNIRQQGTSRIIGDKNRVRFDPNPTPVEKDIEKWENFESYEPSNEELLERGLQPISEMPDKNVLLQPRFLRKDPKKWEQFDDKTKLNEWLKDSMDLLNEFAAAGQNNQFYYKALDNPYIASWIERYINQLWNSLGLTPSNILTNYTETISVDSSKTKVASHLDFDFYKLIIEKIIENGGHLDQLDEVLTEEDLTSLIKFGNFDNAEEVRDVLETGYLGLGDESLGERLGIDFDAVDPNTGEPIAYNFINQILQEKQIEAQNQQLGESAAPSPEQGIIPPVDTGSIVEPQTDLVAPQWDFAQPNEQIVPLTETELPQDIASQLPPEITQAISQGLAYPATDAAGNTTIIDSNTDQVIWPNTFTAKTADYQGWTNWETWNTKLMIDNDYEPYMQSRQLVQNFTPIDQFVMWATETVIAPHNQQALADAQEWNEIPYDERPTGREDISEGGQALIESFDEIFDMDPRSDETAQIIDESKVNWNEIYNSIGEDIKESERYAHEEGKHDLLISDYMTEYSASELAEAQAEAYPWCPVCNLEKPDDPGTTTFPTDWAG